MTAIALSPARPRVARPSAHRTVVRGIRWSLGLLSLACLGIHAWLAIARPDAVTLLMLALAAACTGCLLHAKGALPSVGGWASMAIAGLAMALLHLGGSGPGGHHDGSVASVAASARPGAPATAATAGLDAMHGLAGAATAVELAVAMTALVVCGVQRRRSSHRPE